VLVERGQARVFTRNGFDWSDRYPSIVRAASNLKCKSAIIDGETIVQNGHGASDFEALSSALRQRPHSIIRCRWVGCASSRTYAWPIESHIELLGKHG
jgi:bifunctional non-homologous end joining protein LigD